MTVLSMALFCTTTIPTNTAKRMSPLTEKEPILFFSFRVFRPGFSVALNNLITERMKKKIWNFLISGSTSHKQVLRMGKHVVVGVLISNENFIWMRQT